jgi:hypothetical protein
MKIECDTPEQLQHFKDRAMMLRMLALDDMNEKPLANVSAFSKRQKIKLQVYIEKHWDDEDIVTHFNELCVQTIFEDGKMNPEEMSVGETTDPTIPECELNNLKEWLEKKKIEEEEKKCEEENI